MIQKAIDHGWDVITEDDFGGFTGTKNWHGMDYDLLWTSDKMLSVREDGEQIYRGTCDTLHHFDLISELLGL